MSTGWDETSFIGEHNQLGAIAYEIIESPMLARCEARPETNQSRQESAMRDCVLTPRLLDQVLVLSFGQATLNDVVGQQFQAAKGIHRMAVCVSAYVFTTKELTVEPQIW